MKCTEGIKLGKVQYRKGNYDSGEPTQDRGKLL